MRFSKKSLELVREVEKVIRHYDRFGKMSLEQIFSVLKVRKVLKSVDRDYKRLSYVMNCARKENITKCEIAPRYHGIDEKRMKAILCQERK